MLLRSVWFITLLLAALGLVMGGAHALELPVRMRYPPDVYMFVTSTLYRFFGLVGGPIQVSALLCSIALTWLVRGRLAFWPTFAGALCLALSLVLWFVLVQPVNATWFEALGIGPEAAARAYMDLRSRWELGHVAAFAAWLIGFSLLLCALLREAVPASLHGSPHEREHPTDRP